MDFGNGGFGFSGKGGGGGSAIVNTISGIVGSAGGPVAGQSVWIPLDSYSHAILIGRTVSFMIYNAGLWVTIGNGVTQLMAFNPGTGQISIAPSVWDSGSAVLIQYS